MPITSKEEAFHILETPQWGIPFEAIEFLYEHPADEEIFAKVCFAIEHVNDEAIYFNEEEDFYSPTPLWYAIVAENHLRPELLTAIKASLRENPDWDLFLEQVSVLVGKLCKAFPEEIPARCLEAMLACAKDLHHKPLAIYYLADALLFLDLDKHAKSLEELLRKVPLYELEMMVEYLGGLGFPPTARIIRDRIDLTVLEEQMKGTEDASRVNLLLRLEGLYEHLTTSSDRSSDISNHPFSEIRKPWKKFYQQYASDFEPEQAVEEEVEEELTSPTRSFGGIPPAKAEKHRKIGRNEPCPCGSGKKFKKCCLGLGFYD